MKKTRPNPRANKNILWFAYGVVGVFAAMGDDSVRPYKHFLEELCASFHNRITFYEQVNVPRDIVNLFPGRTVGK